MMVEQTTWNDDAKNIHFTGLCLAVVCFEKFYKSAIWTMVNDFNQQLWIEWTEKWNRHSFKSAQHLILIGHSTDDAMTTTVIASRYARKKGELARRCSSFFGK